MSVKGLALGTSRSTLQGVKAIVATRTKTIDLPRLVLATKLGSDCAGGIEVDDSGVSNQHYFDSTALVQQASFERLSLND